MPLLNGLRSRLSDLGYQSAKRAGDSFLKQSREINREVLMRVVGFREVRGPGQIVAEQEIAQIYPHAKSIARGQLRL